MNFIKGGKWAKMNRVNELIKEYCPDGVPFQKVKDVYTRVKGTPITAGKMKEIACDDGEIRIFAGGKTIIDAHEKDMSHRHNSPPFCFRHRKRISLLLFLRFLQVFVNHFPTPPRL